MRSPLGHDADKVGTLTSIGNNEDSNANLLQLPPSPIVAGESTSLKTLSNILSPNISTSNPTSSFTCYANPPSGQLARLPVVKEDCYYLFYVLLKEPSTPSYKA